MKSSLLCCQNKIAITMSIEINFEGKVALITGASQGIGAEMARAFHRAGATVAINHPDLGSTRHDAESLAAELNHLRPQSALVVAADVANAESVQAMMQDLKQRCDGMDFLINNAAILRDRTVAKMSLDEWKAVIDVNLSGVFHCCKFGLEVMRDGGAIVSMGSIAAILGFYGQANYAATKSGVQALMRVISREAARRGIRANTIAPGVIETSMAATIPENVRAEMLKNVPLGRFGSTGDIANAALFLCSPLAAYVTGQTLEVNGGWRG
jgi:3-oxoacyl-[acyl-carrier protein] reductase